MNEESAGGVQPPSIAPTGPSTARANGLRALAMSSPLYRGPLHNGDLPVRVLSWLRPLVARATRSRPRPTRRPATFRPRLEVLEDRTTPSSGGLLDPTFGSGGVALNTFGSSSRGLTDVTVLPDGKLLTAGFVDNDFVAARYNPDGSFDTSFRGDGLATVDFKGGPDVAKAVAIQPGTGGKILLAGTAYVNGSQFGVVRLNPDGTLDTTFGDKASKGKVTASPAGARVASDAQSMVVLPD